MALMPPLVTMMAKAAEAAARQLNRDFGEVENLQISKKGPSDFVSAADIKAEKTIQYHLNKVKPDFGFLMEEGGKVEGTGTKSRFIIDPIDGTNNFLHGLPHWCISIAAEEEGEITAGVIYDPIRDEMFWAGTGTGAYIRSRKIRASGRNDLSSAIIGGSAPSQGRRDPAVFAKDIENLITKTGGLRTWHSAALNMAYVAAGRLDACYERQISPWDVAAGVLIVREAKGVVSELNGGKDPVYGGTILASNVDLYQDIKALLN